MLKKSTRLDSFFSFSQERENIKIAWFMMYGNFAQKPTVANSERRKEDKLYKAAPFLCFESFRISFKCVGLSLLRNSNKRYFHI